MIYMLDTADLDAIKECVEYFPVEGVTTNPTIISRQNDPDFLGLIKNIRKVIGTDRLLHVQTTAEKAEDILKEAKLLKEFVGGAFYIKIPVTAEGLKATTLCKKEGINVTQTAIFTPQQALIAARAGADFVAPYINRLDNVLGDGVHVVAEIAKIFEKFDIKTKILAASFKNAEQIHKVALVGGHSVTISPELFRTILSPPLTATAVNTFESDWKSVYGETSIADMFENDGI